MMIAVQKPENFTRAKTPIEQILYGGQNDSARKHSPGHPQKVIDKGQKNAHFQRVKHKKIFLRHRPSRLSEQAAKQGRCLLLPRGNHIRIHKAVQPSVDVHLSLF